MHPGNNNSSNSSNNNSNNYPTWAEVAYRLRKRLDEYSFCKSALEEYLAFMSSTVEDQNILFEDYCQQYCQQHIMLWHYLGVGSVRPLLRANGELILLVRYVIKKLIFKPPWFCRTAEYSRMATATIITYFGNMDRYYEVDRFLRGL